MYPISDLSIGRDADKVRSNRVAMTTSFPSGQECIDIRAKASFPAGALSNFAAHPFTLDGVTIKSMEGFLQSLKFADIVEQADICLLAGAEAQSRGRRQDWSSGILWWRGKSYDRLSDDYQGLLDRAFDALFEQAPKFRNALSAAGRATLTHRIGKSDPCETILTASEFCGRLDRLRTRLHELSRR
jgi:Bacteriophage protein GP30.3